jgi:DNA modification methylase
MMDKIKYNLRFYGNCLDIISSFKAGFDITIADPPYDDIDLINSSIRLCREVTKGPSFFFMYAENIYDLNSRPDQILFWIKPISTKNTTKRYSRFAEVICCYDLDETKFNQGTHWSTRTGIFFDSFAYKQDHPYQKPTSLIEKLLAVHVQDNTARVLDPFAGSFTVEKVCKDMGLSSVSIEIRNVLPEGG